ncbi:MAG: hypothetical protein IJO18_01520 [Alphaproteobacteria bacterium]|nr:hypothetical protein [Alphaproteobacteria bacterium]
MDSKRQIQNHSCCPFCGKEFAQDIETNGEHLFPHFVCKQIFGTSDGSRRLQEKIKITTCKECNSKYGTNLELKLKNIIAAISKNDTNFVFRTEEALALLDYMTKTRVLLSFRANQNFDQQLGNFDTVKRHATYDRQLIIAKGPVPDGIYIPKLNLKSGPLSTENTEGVSCFAVVMNGVILISFENKLISETLGFPFTSVALANGTLVIDDKGHYFEHAYVGTQEVSDMWFDNLLHQSSFADSIVLAQPRQPWTTNDYTEKHLLSKSDTGYKYGVHYQTKDKSGWFLKQNKEKGSKGICAYKTADKITLFELEDFLTNIFILENMSLLTWYTFRNSPYTTDEILTKFAPIYEKNSAVNIENILAFDVNEIDLYRSALKVFISSKYTEKQIIQKLYKLVKFINKQKISTGKTHRASLRELMFRLASDKINEIH